MAEYDVAVVGAGILGLCSAREILQRRPATSLVVLEKEAAVATHQTGHNSGVIHSGIYYLPGSLKARLCVSGAKMTYEFCASHAVPVERCGKLIVANRPSELSGLEELYRRGLANGVSGLEMVGPSDIRQLEPHCEGLRALWSPGTGIVDYSLVAAEVARQVIDLGGTILTGRRVTHLDTSSGSVRVGTARGDVRARRVLTCAGLQSDRVAKLSGGRPDPCILPFRGDYWQLRPEKRHLVRNLIYPVPDPALPFLGVHFTRRIADGAIWLGPNAVVALAREGYRRRDVNIADLAQSVRYKGFRPLARRYWRTGIAEIRRDISKRTFVEACRRFVPAMELTDVIPGPSGVRAQALTRDGALVDDFSFDNKGEVIMHVRNAPSPGATSAFAIAQVIADEWDNNRQKRLRPET